MARHRTTYITDDDGKVEHGSYVVEAIEEPNRVQEFRVRIESPTHLSPWTREYLHGRLLGHPGTVTVTEVEPS